MHRLDGVEVGRQQAEVADQLLQRELLPVVCMGAQMDDVRICLENVLMADAKGAHVANYAEVVEFLKENGKCTGVKARDVLTGKSGVAWRL